MKKVVIVVAIIVVIIIGILVVSFITKERLPEKQIIMSEEAEYFREKSNNIPRELSVEEAVESGYFVYNGIDNKLYNKDVLDRFVENSKSDIKDEIVIVVYNVNGEPLISHIAYKEGKGYVLAKDNTRVDVLKTENVNEDGLVIADPEFYDVIINENISKEYYEISIKEEPGINACMILLKAYKQADKSRMAYQVYEDIEIARYLLDAEVLQD